MDYDQVASKERLTGRAYFNPGLVGGTGLTSMPWLDLGNIQMMSLDYGIRRKEHFKARRGVLIADRFDAFSATPRWTITGDEFTSAILFLIFLGTDVGDVSQAHGNNGAGTAFNVHKGGIYDTGKFAIYNASVTTGTAGTDWIIDAGPGKLYIPLTSSFAEDASKTIVYSWPDITFDKILPPLSNLNRTGTMQLIEEDDSGPVGNPGFVSNVGSPKTIHDFSVSLSTDTGGDTKVDDYKEFKMIATITDPTNWAIRKRGS